MRTAYILGVVASVVLSINVSASAQNNPDGLPVVGHTFTTTSPDTGKTYKWELKSTTALSYTPYVYNVENNMGTVNITVPDTLTGALSFAKNPTGNFTFDSVSQSLNPGASSLTFWYDPSPFPNDPNLLDIFVPARKVTVNGNLKLEWTEHVPLWWDNDGVIDEAMPVGTLRVIRNEAWQVIEVIE